MNLKKLYSLYESEQITQIEFENFLYYLQMR